MTTATTTSGQFTTGQFTTGQFTVRMIDAPIGRRSASEAPRVPGPMFATPLMQRRLPDAPLVQRCVFDVGDTAVCVTTASHLGSTTFSQVLHAVRAEFVGSDALRARADGSRIDEDRIDDPGIDLSAAMAMAVDSAGRILDAAGVEDWCISAGGDVLTRGVSPMRDLPWAVGITEPGADALISQAVCGGDRRAVSTVTVDGAGAAFTQVTAVAPDILTAQLWAAEIRDGGSSDLMLAIAGGLEVLAFGADGRVWASSAFRSRDPEPEA